MLISVVIGAVWTILKGLVKRLEDLKIRGQVETVQSEVRIDQITENGLGHLSRRCYSMSIENPSANTQLKKNSQRSMILMILWYKRITQSQPLTENKNLKNKKKRHVFGPCLRTKRAEENKGSCDANYSWIAWIGTESLGKGTGRVGNRKTNRDYLDYFLQSLWILWKSIS